MESSDRLRQKIVGMRVSHESTMEAAEVWGAEYIPLKVYDRNMLALMEILDALTDALGMNNPNSVNPFIDTPDQRLSTLNRYMSSMSSKE